MRLRELEALQKIAERPGNHFYLGLEGIIPALGTNQTKG